MLPVAALFADGNSPARVMDVAAAPGSKTTQIAARMGNQGAILANEFSASRVKVLHANISRCGIHNVALTHFDGRVLALPCLKPLMRSCSMPPAPAKASCVKIPMP
ncbi:ribosomal RNA small subunit methyltransferase F [Enterobacter cancerogenus]|uniref:Ribosomal RNA small subunit methyltransferase F n=1 Tax=Enterobacter cancerogenus TaxID=69218 RepID=A0A484W4J7_9ENTR|nr:ribosomal RNA small subunit methyltransferase F [Enterobacter cancerogenus]